MQIWLLLSFLAVLVLVVTSVQNNVPVEISFLAWNYQTTLTKLIALTGTLGAAAAACVLLPRLMKKHLTIRRLKKDLSKEKKRSVLVRPAAGIQNTGTGRPSSGSPSPGNQGNRQ